MTGVCCLQFCQDLLLMFDNAWLYNRKTSRVYRYCSKLSEVFDLHIDSAMQKLGYCCGKRVSRTAIQSAYTSPPPPPPPPSPLQHTFVPQVLYCYGKPLCTIPRDTPYYSYQTRASERWACVCAVSHDIHCTCTCITLSAVKYTGVHVYTMDMC